MNIKPKGRASALALVVAVVFAGCNAGLLVPDGTGGGDRGLEVPIMRLSLFEVQGESRQPAGLFVAQAGAGETLQLEAERFPAHNTKGPAAVHWRSLDTAVATVNQNGMVEVVLDAVRPTDVVFAETAIRAEFVDNPTVFAEMTVRVIPDGWDSRSRRINFADVPAAMGAAAAHAHLLTWPDVEQVNDFGDLHLGNGIFLLLGTGGISTAEPIDRGSSSLGLEPNPDRQHSTAFLVNPENPFEFGIAANGSPRPLPASNALHTGGVTNFNDPVNPDPTLNLVGHMRTAGDGGRQFMILGLEKGFEILVRYRANGAGDRWVDIRFGDTSGFRIEGPITPGNGANDGRTVSFRYVDYLYSYGGDGEPEWILENGARVPQTVWTEADGPRIKLDSFVPVTFIEFVGGMQFFEIEVRPIE